jgi:hypothetical protein
MDILSFFAPQPIRTYGNIGFLVVDVIVLTVKLIDILYTRIQARKGINVVGAPAPRTAYLLVVIHLVVGSFILWYGNDELYRLITLLCWGPFLIESVVSEVRKKRGAREREQVTDAAKGESEATVSRETIPESAAAADGELSGSQQGEDAANQEELSENRERRRGRRQNTTTSTTGE